MKTEAANWDSLMWWVGAVIGAFFGGLILVHSHTASVSSLHAPSALFEHLGAASVIALVQVLCLLLAYGIWKYCAPRAATRSLNG